MNKVLKRLCMNCEHRGALGGQLCPFRSLSNEYCDEIETIQKDLELLDCFKEICETLNSYYHRTLKTKIRKYLEDEEKENALGRKRRL